MPSRAEERFAVLIGANAGWANDRPLRYAEADAEKMRDVLLELGGFPPDRVYLLRDPDTEAVRARLQQLARTLRTIDGETLVLVYYSGHADEQFLHLRGAPSLSHVELYEALKALPATVRIGVLDACKSGSIIFTKGGRPAPAFDVKVVNELNVRGLVLLTSSGADELSQEKKALEGSVFTYHLLSGLRGAADQDRSGTITLEEAYHYSFQRTQADTAASTAPHRPAFRFDVQGQGNIALTRFEPGTARLLLPEGQGARYVIVDEHETSLVAEGRSQPRGRVSLALAPGTYFVKRVLGDHLEVSQLDIAPGAQTLAEELAYESLPLDLELLKGGNPEAMDADERREWHRREALRLLSAGEPGMALTLFDEILAQRPNDAGALRGRARALVRRAEGYERVGDSQREREVLRAALEAEPSLAEDSDFGMRYRRLQELEVLERRDEQARTQVEGELLRNPRLKYRWGLGLEVLGTQGALSLSGMLILQGVWVLHVAVDPLALTIIGAPGVDLGARRLFPLERLLTPFVGAGIHLSLAPWPGSWDDRYFELRYRYRSYWGNTLHLDLGVQSLFRTGLAADLGLGVIVFEHRPFAPHVRLMPMLNLSLHWYR
jgi:tetratricopeptide (TPR) repeat protein